MATVPTRLALLFSARRTTGFVLFHSYLNPFRATVLIFLQRKLLIDKHHLSEMLACSQYNNVSRGKLKEGEWGQTEPI